MTTQPVGGRIYEFGMRDRLRIAREEAGFDQRSFEQQTGISRGSISNYERGVTSPKRPALIAWAMATGFSVEWLMTGQVSGGGGNDGGGSGLTNVWRSYENGKLTQCQPRRTPEPANVPAHLVAAA